MFKDLIKQIHSSNVKIGLVATGGGVTSLSSLFLVPGASQSILSASIPYSKTAFYEYISILKDKEEVSKINSYCSENASILLAKSSYITTFNHILNDVDKNNLFFLKNYNNHSNKIIGVSITANLISDQPKKGDHRCHITIFDGKEILTQKIILHKSKLVLFLLFFIFS